ncbi:MAG: nucleotide exchange factor GrpE [Marinilabiliales bacterium]|nr:MAG: nucleotide exchange factor GrpE [Marinilabiliales bacterium]
MVKKKTTGKRQKEGVKTGKGKAAGKEKDPGIPVDKGNAGETVTEDADVAVLEEKLRETENKYLRLAAEFDNYRKRTLKEKSDLVRFAGEDILTGLLPVMDDFDRALQNLDGTNEIGAIKKGVELIYTKLKDYLRRKGVKEIEALGDEFNTDMHEAVTKFPVDDKKKKGRIVDVIEKGYMLHDKVIRYAKVVVGE